jgi:cyclopropane-fatty-acyl-phospholipid synthase
MPVLTSLARRAVRARLEALTAGRIVLVDGDRTESYGDPGAVPLRVTVRDARFYEAVAFGGALAAGEAYADGWWDVNDLTALIRLMLRERDLLDGLERGPAAILNPARRLLNALRANTRAGARRNIRAHYDLSNDFFAEFLDETMTYSAGVFSGPEVSMRDASRAKYERMARLLDLRRGDRVVEIGGGWGGFALYAAGTVGCHVTTTTISAEQHRLARERIDASGVADRIVLLQRDYRDLEGSFDKLVSIEMIEAIGHAQYGRFFEQARRLLAPGGTAAIQAIVIADERYESARREVDFIKRFIFPGSCIPSRAVLRDAAARAGLEVTESHEIGLHYAETLRRWRANFEARGDRIAALGFDERFRRLWRFYFSYCEGGFDERAIGTVQMSLAPRRAA